MTEKQISLLNADASPDELDVFAYDDVSVPETQKITLADLRTAILNHATALALKSAGTTRLTISTTTITSTLPILSPDGSNTAPSHSFSGATGTGIYRIAAANEMGMAAGGTAVAKVTATSFEPLANATMSLGVATMRWQNVRAEQFTLGAVPDAWLTYSGVILTTNATPTTAITIAIPDNTVMRFEVYAVARGTAGVEHGDYYRAIRARRQGGGAPVIVQSATSTLSESTASMDIGGVASSNNLLIQGTGVAATNIDWEFFLMAFRVS